MTSTWYTRDEYSSPCYTTPYSYSYDDKSYDYWCWTNNKQKQQALPLLFSCTAVAGVRCWTRRGVSGGFKGSSSRGIGPKPLTSQPPYNGDMVTTTTVLRHNCCAAYAHGTALLIVCYTNRARIGFTYNQNIYHVSSINSIQQNHYN